VHWQQQEAHPAPALRTDTILQLSIASDANLWRSFVEHVALAATFVTATAPSKTNATLREAAKQKKHQQHLASRGSLLEKM
jgi:hypothetical protein